MMLTRAGLWLKQSSSYGTLCRPTAAAKVGPSDCHHLGTMSIDMQHVQGGNPTGMLDTTSMLMQ